MVNRYIKHTMGALMLCAVVEPVFAWTSLNELTPPAPRMLKANEQPRFEQAMGAMLEEDHLTARKLLQPLAATGVIPAQVALASGLRQLNQPQAAQEAVKWFYFAARAGDEHAQYEVGRALHEGQGIAKDEFAARSWLKQASLNQNEDASTLLAEIDRSLIQAAQQAIASKNYAQAETLLTPLAKDEQPVASQILGKLYVQGMLKSGPSAINDTANDAGRDQSYDKAVALLQKGKLNRREAAQLVDYLQKAASPGNADAQYRLGMMYFTGQMVDKNDEEGLHWYRLAADQGHTEAQFSLGVRYVLGQGIEQDPYEAHRWFKRAAEHGYPKAQHNLALTYMHGIGTDRQIDKAQEWFNKASHAGVQKASGFVDQPNQMKFMSVKAIGADPAPIAKDEPIVEPKPVLHARPPVVMSDSHANTNRPEKPVSAKGSATPQAKVKPVAGWDWFNKLPQKGYTLQVISALESQSVDQFVSENRLDQKHMFRYIERMKNRDWNIVQLGYFETEEQAMAYAKKISKNFTSFTPMVREVKWLNKRLRQKMLQES